MDKKGGRSTSDMYDDGICGAGPCFSFVDRDVDASELIDDHDA